jgi:crotonobetainyl-CoA:carnitine CoA-transferase CaiB-like acyl-CoA transferase
MTPFTGTAAREVHQRIGVPKGRFGCVRVSKRQARPVRKQTCGRFADNSDDLTDLVVTSARQDRRYDGIVACAISLTIFFARIRTLMGQRIIRALATECDVLVENFRSRRMAEWGLSYEQLREINPRLIYCSVSAFGNAKGMEEDGGSGIIGQAYSGLMDVTGDPESGPSKTGAPVVDSSAAMLSAIGILAALYKRAATGVGEHVQASLLEAAYALMPNYVVSVLNGEPNYTRHGSGHPQLVPYQAFPTADGSYVVVDAFHRASWRQLCAALER